MQYPHDAPLHRDPYTPPDLVGMSFPAPAPAQSCGSPYKAVRGCRCSVQVIRAHCDNLDCSGPYCERHNRTRRARDIEDRLNEARKGRPVLYTIPTVPYKRREQAADPKTWRKWIGKLVAFLKKHYDLEYAVERSDPAGEDGERWHPHGNLAWIRKSGRGWLDPKDLQAIKDRWRKIIGLELEEPINVWFRYKKTEAEIRHLCSYLARPWPRWVHACKYMLRVRWYGKPPKAPEREKTQWCDRCGVQIQLFNAATLEEATRIAEAGYDRLLEECVERRNALKRMARCKAPVFIYPAELVTSGEVRLV